MSIYKAGLQKIFSISRSFLRHSGVKFLSLFSRYAGLKLTLKLSSIIETSKLFSSFFRYFLHLGLGIYLVLLKYSEKIYENHSKTGLAASMLIHSLLILVLLVFTGINGTTLVIEKKKYEEIPVYSDDNLGNKGKGSLKKKPSGVPEVGLIEYYQVRVNPLADAKQKDFEETKQKKTDKLSKTITSKNNTSVSNNSDGEDDNVNISMDYAGLDDNGSNGNGDGNGSPFGKKKDNGSKDTKLSPEPKKQQEDFNYYVAVEEMPEAIGGTQGIQSKVSLPTAAKTAGVSGTVYVLAFINEYGQVVSIQLVKGLGYGCDEIALNAVRNTLFRPGKKGGKIVKVQTTVGVRF